jgi:hypothetical protein
LQDALTQVDQALGQAATTGTASPTTTPITND